MRYASDSYSDFRRQRKLCFQRSIGMVSDRCTVALFASAACRLLASSSAHHQRRPLDSAVSNLKAVCVQQAHNNCTDNCSTGQHLGCCVFHLLEVLLTPAPWLPPTPPRFCMQSLNRVGAMLASMPSFGSSTFDGCPACKKKSSDHQELLKNGAPL
jgi:hypothetical protein